MNGWIRILLDMFNAPKSQMAQPQFYPANYMFNFTLIITGV
jgi:hypothetical protein